VRFLTAIYRSGCNLISHALIQLPYTLIAAGLAFVGFVLVA
jgi:hypothetical protein